MKLLYNVHVIYVHNWSHCIIFRYRVINLYFQNINFTCIFQRRRSFAIFFKAVFLKICCLKLRVKWLDLTLEKPKRVMHIPKNNCYKLQIYCCIAYLLIQIKFN
ncbi:uncharacterized protein LOC111027817 [Myzus persicae]|uniref:uncharacterized protein LOC111027817 n=1 Tax=Myzus persicae TaxID=13164 RepID=UPI000B9325E6|nr:uncharacterized protein LOC111027817 [Myzus persicae]